MSGRAVTRGCMRLIHLLTEAGTMFKRMLLLGTAVLLAAACSIDRAHPTDATGASTATLTFSAVTFWEAGATVSWNQLATDLTTAAPAPGINEIGRASCRERVEISVVDVALKKTARQHEAKTET